MIENPQVTGAEAAAVVLIRTNYPQDGDDESLVSLRSNCWHRPTNVRLNANFHGKKTDRNYQPCILLSGDPNLMTFHQGRVGDCYLLAVIGAFVARDPQSVRAMFKPQPDATYEVDFASGKKITVLNATDAELLQGAKMGDDHGIWLQIFWKRPMQTLGRRTEKPMLQTNHQALCREIFLAAVVRSGD